MFTKYNNDFQFFFLSLDASKSRKGPVLVSVHPQSVGVQLPKTFMYCLLYPDPSEYLFISLQKIRLLLFFVVVAAATAFSLLRMLLLLLLLVVFAAIVAASLV